MNQKMLSKKETFLVFGPSGVGARVLVNPSKEQLDSLTESGHSIFLKDEKFALNKVSPSLLTLNKETNEISEAPVTAIKDSLVLNNTSKSDALQQVLAIHEELNSMKEGILAINALLNSTLEQHEADMDEVDTLLSETREVTDRELLEVTRESELQWQTMVDLGQHVAELDQEVKKLTSQLIEMSEELEDCNARLSELEQFKESLSIDEFAVMQQLSAPTEIRVETRVEIQKVPNKVIIGIIAASTVLAILVSLVF